MQVSRARGPRRLALRALLCAGMAAWVVGPPRLNTSLASPLSGASAAMAQLGLIEVGAGTLRFFGLRIYEARLWAPPGARVERMLEGPLALELQYSRRFEGADIARRSIEEMDRLGLVSPGERERWLAELRALFPTVERGDRLLGLYRPQASSPFFFNGQPLGEIPNPRFAQAFFRIWLDPKTSEPGLREALIGRLAG